MTTKFTLRFTKSIKHDNEVIFFDYVKRLKGDYAALSLESWYENREEGYYKILNQLLTLSTDNKNNYSLYFFGQLNPWLKDTKINRYKGYWGLRPKNNHSFDFIEKKINIFSEGDDGVKLSGIARIDPSILEKFIYNISYKNNGFLFLIKIEGCGLIISAANQGFDKLMEEILSQHGKVYFLLGDEDCKSSEVVVIGNINEIENIKFKLEELKLRIMR